MRPGFAGVACAAAWALSACGGEEFAEGGGGASSGGTTSSGGGSSGGTPSGGAAGTTGGAGGSGGAAGAAGGASGTGGSAGAPSTGCGNLHPSDALLYTTLDDESSVTTPAVLKSGVGERVGGSFEDGYCASAGFRVNGAGEFLRFDAAGNIDLVSGTLDFFFMPHFDKTDGQNHRLVGIPGVLLLMKTDLGELTFGLGNAPFASVDAANLPFMQNEWVRVTVVWSTTISAMTQIYFDGVAAPLKYAKTGPVAVPPLSTEAIWIGAFTENDLNFANGVFDDFKIYGGTKPP